MSYSVQVYESDSCADESDSCAVCQKSGSPENPMIVLSDIRRRREESSYISFHVKTCWSKIVSKAEKAIEADKRKGA